VGELISSTSTIATSIRVFSGISAQTSAVPLQPRICRTSLRRWSRLFDRPCRRSPQFRSPSRTSVITRRPNISAISRIIRPSGSGFIIFEPSKFFYPYACHPERRAPTRVHVQPRAEWQAASPPRRGCLLFSNGHLHFQDMDVMGKPVEQRTRKPLGTEHAGPFVKRQV
jgi:hypothetical protein